MARKKRTTARLTRQQKKLARAEARAKKAERKPSETSMCLRSQGSNPDRKTTSDSEASKSVPSASRVEQERASRVQDDQKPGPSSRMVTQDSTPSSSSAVEQASSSSTGNTPINVDDLPVDTETWPLGLDWPVEAILDKRISDGKVEYLIRWAKWSDDFDSWEPEENCEGCQEMLEEFNRACLAKRKKVGGPGRGWTKKKLEALKRSLSKENDNSNEDSEEHSSPKKQKTK